MDPKKAKLELSPLAQQSIDDEKLRKVYKPLQLSHDHVEELCQSLFNGKTITILKELDSYDDRNYLLTMALDDSSTTSQYVFKVHNGMSTTLSKRLSSSST